MLSRSTSRERGKTSNISWPLPAPSRLPWHTASASRSDSGPQRGQSQREGTRAGRKAQASPPRPTPSSLDDRAPNPSSTYHRWVFATTCPRGTCSPASVYRARWSSTHSQNSSTSSQRVLTCMKTRRSKCLFDSRAFAFKENDTRLCSSLISHPIGQLIACRC